MLGLLILKLMFYLLDCMHNLQIIIYTKPPIRNDSPMVGKLAKSNMNPHFASVIIDSEGHKIMINNNY